MILKKYIFFINFSGILLKVVFPFYNNTEYYINFVYRYKKKVFFTLVNSI